MSPADLADDEYRRLLELRVRLREFLRWSAGQAAAGGLSPAQHQLLLAVRGHDDGRGPTIGELAAYLLCRHHSAVGLVDRAEAAGLVRRRQDHDDQRVVRVVLTRAGRAALLHLSRGHLEELRVLAAGLVPLLSGGLPAAPAGEPAASPTAPAGTAAPAASSAASAPSRTSGRRRARR